MLVLFLNDDSGARRAVIVDPLCVFDLKADAAVGSAGAELLDGRYGGAVVSSADYIVQGGLGYPAHGGKLVYGYIVFGT